PLLAAAALAAFQACAQTTSRAPVSDSAPAAESPPAAEAPPASEAAPAAETDPRVGLAAGVFDAEEAAWNMELVATVPKPEGFIGPGGMADLLFANSDLAFQGEHVFVGSFQGFNIYDISVPAEPELEVTVVCPGGQGDLSVYGDFLFMSVEMPNGRIDCRDGAMDSLPSGERFRGVRIWDISDLEHPEEVAYVQTCRGSHTHTLVTDPDDGENVYIYVSGVSVVRPAEELAGCSGALPAVDPNTSLFRIEVIQVPLDNPEAAEIVSAPHIFADAETDSIAGLWAGGSHGPGTQTTARTDQCHDITAYPEIGRAAGACSGNGILLDITDPAHPVRIDQVVDPNFAYWHSATFNDDASKVIFTDEWGGGLFPRCLATDDPQWGADAIFDLEGGELELAGYYKLPAPQTARENCVAHNGSLIPVPGRDIMVQAWYQGGVSVFDFTDSGNPVEIAFFDRGPMRADSLALGGQWSAYWYNGHIYGSEIGRGLDVFALTPSEQLTGNEIEAAKLAQVDRLNVQTQRRFVWPASPVVARAYLDQIAREDPDLAAGLSTELERAEGLNGDERTAALTALAARAEGVAGKAEAEVGERLELLAAMLRKMGGA
ncbi:MAG: LVIVD repeat-containing protein, partial [Gemmatimonadota bacterium]